MPNNTSGTPTIEHIVVLMLENRSYDNFLGGLYLDTPAPAGQADLNGLGPNPAAFTNVNPAGGAPIAMATAANTTVPSTDPGETVEDMAQQIYGLTEEKWWWDTYPTAAGPLGMMGGFTTNYACQKTCPPPQDVMTYFTPAQIPVTAFLAANFAVSDCWYGSAPLQTYPNRAFAHCGAPGYGFEYSYLNDSDYILEDLPLGLNIVTLPSIFSKLDDVLGTKNGPNWKVYFHDFANAMVLERVYQLAQRSDNVNVATFDNSDWGTGCPKNLGANPPTFLDDVANGTLPKYAFIEPRYTGDYATNTCAPNSNHPGVGAFPHIFRSNYKIPTDVINGEILLATVYNAIRNSPYWENTLLIVTYDEHGGLYDHVTPPGAAQPGPSCPPGSDSYDFKTLGPRVPALLISQWVAAGSTFRPSANATQPFDHTTLIKTVWDCFGLGDGSLTHRDAAAESLMAFVNTASAANPAGTAPLPVAKLA